MFIKIRMNFPQLLNMIIGPRDLINQLLDNEPIHWTNKIAQWIVNFSAAQMKAYKSNAETE